MPNRDHLVFIFIIAAITLLVYYDSFNNGFVYDDYPFLVENPSVRKLDMKSILADFTEMTSVSSDEKLARDVWRPLMTLSFALDYRLWKLNARFYHIENVFFHIANAILVYIATVLVIGDGFTAFIAAIVFAIHPVQTEAVTWVSGRSNVLFLFFFLSAFLAHVQNRRRGPRTPYYFLSLIFFSCSLMSKEMAIILPLILILYDIHFFRKDVRAGIGYYTPFFLVCVSYILTRFSVLGVIAQKGEWWGSGFLDTAFVTLKAVAEYVRLLIVPVNLRVEYMAPSPKAIAGTQALAVFMTLASVALLYAAVRRKKAASFYILWFFVALIPVYNIVPFKAVMAERFLYLPLIGFAALFGILFSKVNTAERMAPPVKYCLVSILVSVMVAYGMISISRNIEWRDEISFYTREAALSASNPRAHYNLGYVYAKKASETAGSDKRTAGAYYALAIEEFKKAIALKPDSQSCYFALGNAYNALGWYDLAIKNFRKAAAIREDSYVYNNLGIAYYRKGMYDAALGSFRKALRLDAGHRNASVNLGNAYYMKRDYARAKQAWLRVIRSGRTEAGLAESVKALEKEGY